MYKILQFLLELFLEHKTTIILLIISAAAMAIMWTLQFHFPRSVFKNWNQKFWNPAISEWNKYKSPSDRRPKFFGSTTFLVWTTCAFHLFQFIFLNSFVLAFAINLTWSSWWINFIIVRGIIEAVWWLLFEWLLVKK